jgi:acyl-CoA oxidase
MQKQVALGMTQNATLQEHLMDFVTLARLHSHRYLLHTLSTSLRDHPHVSSILSQLCSLSGIYFLLKEESLLAQSGYLRGSDAQRLTNTFQEQCKMLRKDVIPLVDAWGLPDFILQAPIGKYDGDIYKGEAVVCGYIINPNLTISLPRRHKKCTELLRSSRIF